MSDVILQARNVWKVFGKGANGLPGDPGAWDAAALRRQGGVVGVQNATFDVRRGESFVIMGLSGSGKSTLLRCMTGLYPVSGGNVILDGVDLSRASRDALVALRRQKVGMVFQSFALLPHLTALDNVAFPLQVTGVPRAARRERAAKVLALVGLNGLEGRFPSQMSGGQQQRVGIARSLIADPAVWFLDEPFSALDPLIRREMQDEFMRLQSQLQKSIVFVTHDLEEAVRLGDRIVIMAEGRILQIGTPEDVIMNPATDYVRRFVSGMPKSRVVRVGRIMQDASNAPEPTVATIAASATLSEVLPRLLQSSGPVPVADADGRIVGTVDRNEVVAWL
ncbi:quaternary amine ABC transporter ATP-binding protein [Thauera sp. SDU_THAU2]|uniref:quaternary amine ABC transporter ATP-binding protein n=1 Tax=Thauera sp. SDU_THAU2 TaxID=3136633 RepID=UPI00311E056A